MRSIVYAGNDFSEICSAEVIERAANPIIAEAMAVPGRAGALLVSGYIPPVDVRVRLFMDMGYNPGLMYQEYDKVRLTSNGAFLFLDGNQVFVDDLFHPVFLNGYQWLRKAEIHGSEFYYHQGETWQQAISANRDYNEPWSINDGKVIFLGDLMLVDANREPVDPTATIDPSTVNYDLEPIMDN